MDIEKFSNLDTSFNAGIFLTNVNHLFLKILTSLMLDQLEDIQHLVSKDVYKLLEDALNEVKKENRGYLFEDIDIRNSLIVSIEVNESVYIIKVFLQSVYMDYIINLSDNTRVPINKSLSRLYGAKKEYLLTFTKKAKVNKQTIVKKCSGCGAPINLHRTRKCQYCGAIYKQEDMDWILTKLEIS